MNKSYYLDTNAFFKYYCLEKGSEQIRELVDNKENISYISELTYLEITNMLLAIYRTPKKDQLKNPNRLQAYSKKQVKLIITRMLGDIENCFFKLEKVPMDNLFENARTLLLNHAENLNFGSLDALHIAIIESNWKNGEIYFVTSDGSGGGRLIGMCKKLNIPVYDPEKNMYF
jgi:predicted nucleic acid-binding protein